MIGPRLALLSIFAVSLGLLVEEIMLSAIFNVLLGAGTTSAIEIAATDDAEILLADVS